MSFFVAGVVAVGTLVLCGLMFLGASMSDSPTAAAAVPLKSTFIMGMVIALLILASHWLPHIGW